MHIFYCHCTFKTNFLKLSEQHYSLTLNYANHELQGYCLSVFLNRKLRIKCLDHDTVARLHCR